MAHETPLITAIVMGLCLAFLFGAIANRLRISPLVGYLLAGVIAGPNTPGFHADAGLTNQLAEIGVILLMFGVGLHFSMKDLLSVRAIAVPGAIVQMVTATFLGTCLGLIMGWNISNGLTFGLALSTASTVVLLRAMQERRLIETKRGRIAVGWLIVEDMAMVFALVLLPSLASISGATEAAPVDPIAIWFNFGITGIIGLTITKVILFIATMMVIGRRLIPLLLKIIAQTGSRELFSLSVLAIALGVAFGAAHLFGVSLALGAFFAGMIMSESELCHRAAEETLPLRDAFAVLFFVSVGMLFEPMKVIHNFIPLFATLLIIIFGKSLAAFLIVRAFRHPIGTSLTISASLAQIGEFSFILAGFGNTLGILNDDARDLILGGAILSILLNPLVFVAVEKVKQKFECALIEEKVDNAVIESIPKHTEEQLFKSSKTGHTVIIGFSRVGQLVTAKLGKINIPVVIIEDVGRNAEKARNANLETITGNAVYEDILDAANIAHALKLVLTISNTFEAGRIVSIARNRNSDIHIVAHALSESEGKYLSDLGVDTIVADDQQIANGIIGHLVGIQTVPREKDTDTIGPILFVEEERAVLS
ncbi:MAG: monovalent cation:H+ antiporter-2 [Candidatus Tokpelaia sp. JSC189]|nr:MAG: monovalent cation:H+ antiporter-2 [Candidatus Tokpelaia sp. JSC189]